MSSHCKRFLIWSAGCAFLAGCSAAPARHSPTDAAMPAVPVPAQVPASAAAPPNTVFIDNFTYYPQTLTIAPGTTLTWTNRDDIPHTVTSTTSPRLLNSPILDTDQSFRFTFTAPGTYAYFCTLHPHMTGTITVK